MQVPEALLREREKHATQHEFILKSVDSAKQALAEAECRQRIAVASIAAFDFSIRVIEDIEMPIAVTSEPENRADAWVDDTPWETPAVVLQRQERSPSAKPRQPKRDLRQVVRDAIVDAGPDGTTHAALSKGLKVLPPRIEELVLDAVNDGEVVVLDDGTGTTIYSSHYNPGRSLSHTHHADEDAAAE